MLQVLKRASTVFEMKMSQLKLSEDNRSIGSTKYIYGTKYPGWVCLVLHVVGNGWSENLYVSKLSDGQPASVSPMRQIEKVYMSVTEDQLRPGNNAGTITNIADMIGSTHSESDTPLHWYDSWS